MVQDPLLECSFLIPVSRDSNLADGGKHQPLLWDWIENELHDRFGGLTLAPGTQQGSYIDPDTRQRIVDESVKFTVAVSESRIQDYDGYFPLYACCSSRNASI